MDDLKNLDILDFGIETKMPSQIVVMGVGGAGGNAVNYLLAQSGDAVQGIDGVSFIACNTDKVALDRNLASVTQLLGTGKGAGNLPEKGKVKALESLDEIMYKLEEELGLDSDTNIEDDPKMLIIAAGMGKGTGTGASPVIAKAARDRGILTVAFVTMPLSYEGKQRMNTAEAGLEELRKSVDAVIVVQNDNITRIYGDLPIEDAFNKSDDILAQGVIGLAEMGRKSRPIMVDMADVRVTIKDSGTAYMAVGSVDIGDNNIDIDHIKQLCEETFNSPLLDHNNIYGAKKVLCSLTYPPGKVSIGKLEETLKTIQEDTGGTHIIWGAGEDTQLSGEVRLTMIATGFDENSEIKKKPDTRDNNASTTKPKTKKFDIDKLKREPAFARREGYKAKLADSTVNPTGKATTILSDDSDAADAAQAQSGELF